MSLAGLLAAAVSRRASDLHLKAGTPPLLRIGGALTPLAEQPVLQPADLQALAGEVLSDEARRRLEDAREVDLAFSLPGVGRFRCNIYHQRGTLAMALRLIPDRIPSFEDLALPAVLQRIAAEARGLVLVTGATGSGKSTTLAAIIDHINHHRAAHVMTIEDPIEYLHQDRRSAISQREVSHDTPSFPRALRSALRQDPDVILVGEMRDLETIETALLAAETGHLVLSTLHTVDATETIHRIVSACPPHQQRQIRLQVANVLKAVVSQRLIPRADGQGRCPAVEVLIATAFIRDCIADEGRTALIPEAIASGTSPYGMQTFDQSIFALYSQGLISHDEALRCASNADEFTLKVQGISSTRDMADDGVQRHGNAPEIVRYR